MAKRALFIEHDHVSPSGPLGERFVDHGYELHSFGVVSAENFDTPNVKVTFPNFSQFDVVVPMGSPWGVWEDERIGNWLLPELENLRQAHNAGVPILGVCFGGQLMARALGGRVVRAEKPEVGWRSIDSSTPDISTGPWFQYHWDRWFTPDIGQELARTEVGPQAFRAGRTLGLQFHPEMTGAILELWLEMDGGCAEVESVGIDPDVLRQETLAIEQEARARTHALVDYFIDSISHAQMIPAANSIAE